MWNYLLGKAGRATRQLSSRRRQRNSRIEINRTCLRPTLEQLEERALLATLGPGDLVFTGYQASSNDKISFVLLKSVDSGTVLTITDNAWTGAALSTNEGSSVITFGGSLAAGTQLNYDSSRSAGLRWAVGSATTNLTDVTSGGFALSTSGDNLFAYNGSTAPTSGSSSAWVSALASRDFLTVGPTTSNSTLLPAALATSSFSFSLGLASGASNQNGAYTSGSVNGSTAQIQSSVYNVGNWTSFTTAGAQAIPPNATFTVQFTGNNAPTGLALTNTTIVENAGSNAIVGSLSTTDPDIGDTFSYSFVAGAGSADNASFNISGNVLRANNTLDFETKSSYSVRLRTTDQGGLSFDQSFIIQVIDINENVNLRLNELKVNPPGGTTAGNKFQYVELLGQANLSLSNTYLVMLNGNGAASGIASYVANLTAYSLGSNGLLMLKSPTGGHNAASGTTVVADAQFDLPAGILSKQTVSFYLVSATTSIIQGNDYDLNNDGVLDNLPSGFSIVDHVGWTDGDAGDFVYGGVALTQSQGTPDAATRIVGNTSIATSAWFNGNLDAVGNQPSQLLYDAIGGSQNLPVTPVVASLTPGATNFVNSASGATNLRIVNYNLAAGAEPNMLRPGLSTILEAIGNEVVAGISRPIDVLAMQEIYSQANTSAVVASLLNGIYGASIYAHGVLNGLTSGSGTLGVVYNTQTLQLLGETTVGTVSTSGQARQTLRYHFQPIGGDESTDFFLYNSHWKAADDAESRSRRLVEAQAIRSNADALGNGENIIYVGDFNVYSGSELAFQTMIGAGNGQANDPLNRIGSWSDNPSFIDVFTQAPASSAPSGLVGGGLDDRFDFQLITGELLDNQGIDYRPGSYRSFGNNGSVAINSSVNSPSSTALSGLANRTTVLNLLTTVSDHLPVVADYTLFTALIVNQPPTGADRTVETDMNVPYTLMLDDFGFADPNNTPPNAFDSVVISSLPVVGALTLNGQPVTAGQSITVAAIEAGNLRYTPALNGTGTPYASFSFQVRDNGGTANGGINLDPTPNFLTIHVNPIILPEVRFNEILVNPSGADNAREFIELIRLSPSETLSNVWLLEIETDNATGRGTVDMALPLSSANFGANDLLLIGHNYETSIPYSIPTETGRFNLSRPNSSTIENSVNLLLVYNFNGTVGVDYDLDNDGTLDSLPWVAVIDAVAIGALNEPVYAGGAQILNSDNSGEVDAVVRFPGDPQASTATAFYGGDILDTGTGGNDLQFQTAPYRTANFPAGGILTPGAPNAPTSLSTPAIQITSVDQVYNNASYMATASVTGFATPDPTGSLSFEFYSDAAGTVIIPAPVNVGTYFVRAFTAANAGNNAGQSAISSFVITPKHILGNITVANKIFDGNTNATIVSRSLSGVILGDVVEYVGGLGLFDSPWVGVDKTVVVSGLSLQGADAANYSVNSTATATASIVSPGISELTFSHVYHANSSFAAGGIAAALDVNKTLAKETSAAQTLSLNNLTNSSRGINGLEFDIQNLPNLVSASDFEFQVSPQGAFNLAVNPPANWQTVAAPTSVTIIAGAVSRVILEWPDNAIANRWLRITWKANANTGLVAPEVYYIGHLLGETTGQVGGIYTVAFADITPIRGAVGQTVNNGSIHDIDKSGIVSFADISAMRGNVGAQLTNITIQALSLGAAGGGSSGETQPTPNGSFEDWAKVELPTEEVHATIPMIHWQFASFERAETVDLAWFAQTVILNSKDSLIVESYTATDQVRVISTGVPSNYRSSFSYRDSRHTLAKGLEDTEPTKLAFLQRKELEVDLFFERYLSNVE